MSIIPVPMYIYTRTPNSNDIRVELLSVIRPIGNGLRKMETFLPPSHPHIGTVSNGALLVQTHKTASNVLYPEPE